MNTEIINSVNKLKDELEKRIQLLTSGTTSANLDKDAYEELVDIINSVTHMSPSKLTSEDVTNFRLVEIERILEIICVDDNTKNMIINSFNPNVYSIKNAKSETRVSEIMNFFEEIRRIIIRYLEEYDMINSNQKNVQDTKVAEYTYYIDLLSRDNFEKLFIEEDINKLLKLMSNFAIPISDRQHILQYIAIKNLSVPVLDNNARSEEQLNMMSRVNAICELYLYGHEKEKEMIESELETDDIDIDLIPTIAKDIAKKKELDENLVCGILIAMVGGNLLTAYTAALESQVDDKIIDSYKVKLENVLGLEDQNEFTEISVARRIISDTYDFYVSETDNETDVSEYLDLLLTDIEGFGVDRTTAVDLKTLPIIKSIAETLDKIDKLDKNSEDYVLCRNMLHELIAAYDNLIEKKNTPVRKAS